MVRDSLLNVRLYERMVEPLYTPPLIGCFPTWFHDPGCCLCRCCGCWCRRCEWFLFAKEHILLHFLVNGMPRFASVLVLCVESRQSVHVCRCPSKYACQNFGCDRFFILQDAVVLLHVFIIFWSGRDVVFGFSGTQEALAYTPAGEGVSAANQKKICGAMPTAKICTRKDVAMFATTGERVEGGDGAVVCK